MTGVLPMDGDGRMTRRRARQAIGVMCVGLVLTIAVTIVPYVEGVRAHLADHIEAGYPTYSHDRIEQAVTTYRVLLTAVGGLGVIAWLVTIWAVAAGKRWANLVAAVMLAAGMMVWLTELLTKDTSGDTGLPLALGSLGAAPCAAGLAAVLLLWSGREDRQVP